MAYLVYRSTELMVKEI